MLNEPVLVDTGPLIALYNKKDPWHDRCRKIIGLLPVGKAYTCWPVVVEAAYILRGHPAERNRLFDALLAQEFILLPLDRDDLREIQVTLDRYRDQNIDFADASLVQLANRESIAAVFTLDRRHFGMFRRQNGSPFRLILDVLQD
jgi:uncharacterized protein